MGSKTAIAECGRSLPDDRSQGSQKDEPGGVKQRLLEQNGFAAQADFFFPS